MAEPWRQAHKATPSRAKAAWWYEESGGIDVYIVPHADLGAVMPSVHIPWRALLKAAVRCATAAAWKVVKRG